MSTAFTLDLEDHTGAYARRGRHLDVAWRILDWCDAQDIRGTVFVVGRLAASAPDLVREVAARGHEVACHSWSHEALDRLGAEAFRADTLRAKGVLEDIVQRRVVGYRAPVFSLTRATSWAPAILREAEFEYSSSVMPARNPLHGFPEAPDRPFRWPSGLVELPCPVRRLGPLSVPYLGGIYLRYLPLRVVESRAPRARGVVPPVLAMGDAGGTIRARHDAEDDTAAVTPVAAVGPAAGDVLLPVETDHAPAAIPALDKDYGSIDEHPTSDSDGVLAAWPGQRKRVIPRITPPGAPYRGGAVPP